MDFELRLLRCALALAEHRNFARAAGAVHISQPALSRAIKELEQRAGTQLFDRVSTGVEPTDAGIVFLDHARDVMSRAADLGREMALLKGLDTGELRIGAGTYPSHMYVDRALARLVRKHPSVSVKVVVDNWGNLLAPLRKRKIDLAVMDASEAENDSEMHVIPLRQRKGYMVLRAGHPLLKGNGGDQLAATWNYPFITTSRFPTAVFRDLAAVLLGAQKDNFGSKVLMSVACESLHMMKTIALESDGVALLPLNMVADEMGQGTLVAIPAPEWLRGNFGIVHLAHRSLSPLADSFVREVRQADEELYLWEEKTARKLFGCKRARALAS